MLPGATDAEKIRQLRVKILDLEEQLRPQREKIQESEREISQLQEKHESKKELSDREWQNTRKELKSLKVQLRHRADLLHNDQHQQLSEALGLSEQQPSEVLESYVAFEYGKVAAAQVQASVIRQKHLINYTNEARDLAGQLLEYENQLTDHMGVLNERKAALEELESCGGKYTKELTECDQLLKQLQEKLQLAQAQLKSCKERLHLYKEQLEMCLDEMNRCIGTLSRSQIHLKRCLANIMRLRAKLTDEVSILDREIQRGTTMISKLVRNVFQSGLFGYSDKQLEEKKTQVQKCNDELEGTESTLERLGKTLDKFEMELGKLKECIKKARDPQPTGSSAACTQPDQVGFQVSLDCVIL